MDPYIVNALIHLNLVAIHPFSDGNGRVARLLCSLLMMREGYRAQAFWSLEQYLGEHSEAYGAAIAEALGPRSRPNLTIATSWMERHLEAVATQVTDAEQRLRTSMAEFRAVVGGIVATDLMPPEESTVARTVLPVWLALTGGSVTRRQVARYIDLSPDTLTRALRRLAEQGLLVRRGRGRAARYEPGRITEVWEPFDEIVQLALDGGVDAVVERLRTQQQALFP
jgi:Fic family protein